MRNKQTIFFSLLSDLEPVIKQVEGTEDVHYFLTGLLDSKRIPQFDSATDIPNLGLVSSGDWMQNEHYLVMPKKDEPEVRKVPQRAGGVKYAVDQLINPKSIGFKPGGIYKDGVLLAGDVSTVSDDEWSDKLYMLLYSTIKKKFKKIGRCYVGAAAEQKLKNGWRLVTSERSPKEYDLTLD